MENKSGGFKYGLWLCILFLMIPVLSLAGGYSDYSANKSRAERASNRTLNYGGTYGQAGQDYMNYRHGYGTGSNHDFYSRHYPTGKTKKQEMTPEKKAEIDRLLKQTDALLERIENDPKLWK